MAEKKKRRKAFELDAQQFMAACMKLASLLDQPEAKQFPTAKHAIDKLCRSDHEKWVLKTALSASTTINYKKKKIDAVERVIVWLGPQGKPRYVDVLWKKGMEPTGTQINVEMPDE